MTFKIKGSIQMINDSEGDEMMKFLFRNEGKPRFFNLASLLSRLNLV